MKTIKIRDDVYEKLVEIKGDKSFSDVIDELIEESKKKHVIKGKIKTWKNILGFYQKRKLKNYGKK